MSDFLKVQKTLHRLTHPSELVVERACVADGLAEAVPPPERGGGGLAVGARDALTAGRGLSERRKESVGLLLAGEEREEVLGGPVPKVNQSPRRRGGRKRETNQ